MEEKRPYCDTNLDRTKTLAWYDEVVSGPLLSHNVQYYHKCCNVYTKRGRVENKYGHTKSVTFSSLFTLEKDPELIHKQVKKFYLKYCQDFGGYPLLNIAHIKRPCDLSDEEIKPAKSGKKKSKVSRALSLDSCLQKEKEPADAEMLKLEESFLYRTTTVQNQICDLRTETSRVASLSKRLVSDNKTLAAENKALAADNQRLSIEVSKMKKQLEEQKQALKAFHARLDAIEYGALEDILGKRQQPESPIREDQSASGGEESMPKSRSIHARSTSVIGENEEEGTYPAN